MSDTPKPPIAPQRAPARPQARNQVTMVSHEGKMVPLRRHPQYSPQFLPDHHTTHQARMTPRKP